MEIINTDVLDELTYRIRAISVFVHNQKHYFVLAEKEYFELDVLKAFHHYLKEGYITKEEFDISCKEYRGGILQLKKENFEDFLKIDEISPLSLDELKHLLFKNFEPDEINAFYQRVENQLAYNVGMSRKSDNNEFLKIDTITTRMPLFYINFDTKTYFHMNWERSHELSAYEDWDAKEFDFGYLIPDEFCYWKVDGKDFWKFRQL